MKSKVDKLDVDKLLPVPVDWSKLSEVVKNFVVKKDVHNPKIKNIGDKIPDITSLATKTTLNAKVNTLKLKYLIVLTKLLKLLVMQFKMKYLV